MAAICSECGLKHGSRKPVGPHTGRITDCDWCDRWVNTLSSFHYGLDRAPERVLTTAEAEAVNTALDNAVKESHKLVSKGRIIKED